MRCGHTRSTNVSPAVTDNTVGAQGATAVIEIGIDVAEARPVAVKIKR